MIIVDMSLLECVRIRIQVIERSGEENITESACHSECPRQYRQADIHDGGRSNIPACDKRPAYGGYPDQKILVNVTRMLLQDLVVLGGPTWISVTDGTLIAGVTAPVHLVDLDQYLEREMVAREMALATLVMTRHQIARIRIICAQLLWRPRQPPCRPRRIMTDETVRSQIGRNITDQGLNE